MFRWLLLTTVLVSADELFDAFAQSDRDRSGSLSMKELERCVARLKVKGLLDQGTTATEMMRMADAHDTDGVDGMDFAELSDAIEYDQSAAAKLVRVGGKRSLFVSVLLAPFVMFIPLELLHYAIAPNLADLVSFEHVRQRGGKEGRRYVMARVYPILATLAIGILASIWVGGQLVNGLTYILGIPSTASSLGYFTWAAVVNCGYFALKIADPFDANVVAKGL